MSNITTIDRLLAFAVVRLKMSIADFRSLSFSQWNAIVEEHFNYENHRIRESWEQTRQISYCSIAHVLEKGVTIKRFQPLPWDNDTKISVDIPTQEELQKMVEFFGD